MVCPGHGIALLVPQGDALWHRPEPGYEESAVHHFQMSKMCSLDAKHGEEKDTVEGTFLTCTFSLVASSQQWGWRILC